MLRNFHQDVNQGNEARALRSIKNQRILSNYASFTLTEVSKAAHHQIWHIGEINYLFRKGMTNLVL